MGKEACALGACRECPPRRAAAAPAVSGETDVEVASPFHQHPALSLAVPTLNGTKVEEACLLEYSAKCLLPGRLAIAALSGRPFAPVSAPILVPQ